MITITFNAFSFLQKKLKKQNIEFSNPALKIPEGITPNMLLLQYNLTGNDVEAVMINGKASSFDTVIKDQDRVALVPPGMPGPYRVLLGFVPLAKK